MKSEDKLKLLKDILLTEERTSVISLLEKIKLLERKLEQTNQKTNNLEPIIDKKLDGFAEEIPVKFSTSITKALKTEIKTSQDEVVETLYPILGKMIKKYIAHEFKLLSEKINTQLKKLNKPFSFSSKKNKEEPINTQLQADLILQEQNKPRMEQFLVIEKGSGILLSEYSVTEKIDKHMVAGMLTAIKSFIEDAFNNNAENLELIEYETYTIYLQNFSSYYIAVIISGTFTISHKDKLEDKLLDFAKNIINKSDLREPLKINKKLKKHFTNEYL